MLREYVWSSILAGIKLHAVISSDFRVAAAVFANDEEQPIIIVRLK